MIHTDNESFLDKIKWVFTFFQPKRSDVYLMDKINQFPQAAQA